MPEPAIQRPDGSLYRPRTISANAIVDEDEILCGVMVLGTHDVLRAQPLADQYAVWQLGSGYTAAGPLTGWWRDGFEGGRRCWVTDERRGRAGVWFREVVERTPVIDIGYLSLPAGVQSAIEEDVAGRRKGGGDDPAQA
jgi:hypothetical protein